jgi:hypothetical protein
MITAASLTSRYSSDTHGYLAGQEICSFPYVSSSYAPPEVTYSSVCLFNDTVSISDCIASNDRTNNELERIWKEALVVQLKAISLHLSEKKITKNPSRQSVSGPRFEPRIS